MADKEIDSAEIADAMGLSNDDFAELISGRRRLSEQDAGVLSDNLGSTARFWLARDKAYVLDSARLNVDLTQSLQDTWLSTMPIASMRKLGWLDKAQPSKKKLQSDLLAFFGCNSLQEWGLQYSSGVGAVAFRTSLSLASDGMATLVWLRAGEIAASEQSLPKFDRTAFRRMLPSLKKLSAYKRPSSFLSRLIEACRAVGVAVATARTPEGCRASGATWFNGNGNPIILLSFRHMSEDHFWFTFFHEAGHVVLHGKNHIDGESAAVIGDETETQEAEANRFAQELLFPSKLREGLRAHGIHKNSIIAIARQADVTPGIIVGQLQRSKDLDHNKLNFLKRRYRWGSDSMVPNLID